VRLHPPFLWEMIAGAYISPSEFSKAAFPFSTLIGRFRAKRVSSPPPDPPAFLQKPAHLQKASVEQIWSSWRYEKQAPKSIDPAERVNQLKRVGDYETALQVALAEVRLEEQGGRRTGEQAMVPGTTGSGHDLSEAQAIR
jgi:hypothetical protein